MKDIIASILRRTPRVAAANERVSREDILDVVVNEGGVAAAVESQTKADGKGAAPSSPPEEPQLVILDGDHEEELMDVFAEAFVDDPLCRWIAGLDCEKLRRAEAAKAKEEGGGGGGGERDAPWLRLDDGQKREMMLKLNRILNGWGNRPVIVGNKGVAIGVLDADADDGDGPPALVGGITLVPSRYDYVNVADVVKNCWFVGLPPIYTSQRRMYGPHAHKRLNATSVLTKGNIDEIMEREHGIVDYLLIESVGVLSAHRGRGLGGGCSGRRSALPTR